MREKFTVLMLSALRISVFGVQWVKLNRCICLAIAKKHGSKQPTDN
jgi:hypothetical protein